MVVLVVVGLLYMSISSLDSFRIMRRSREYIHPLLSYVGLSFTFVCIWFMFVDEIGVCSFGVVNN